MKIPISKRLMLCASFVEPGAAVADIGADHGYLGIYLIQKGLAEKVIASDLREKPITRARHNAEHFGVSERMTFLCAPGLEGIAPGSVDTVVCAGMGSDCMIEILGNAPWLKDPHYHLILQPQSSGQDLRRYLGAEGFSIEKEDLVEEKGFLYTVLASQFDGVKRSYTPGRLFLSDALRESASPLLELYRFRVLKSIRNTLEGMGKGNADKERLDFYRQACDELSG